VNQSESYRYAEYAQIIGPVAFLCWSRKDHLHDRGLIRLASGHARGLADQQPARAASHCACHWLFLQLGIPAGSGSPL